jgi:hypothetical protein
LIQDVIESAADVSADFYTRRSDPAQEAQRLIVKLEALGHKVTPGTRRLNHRTRLRRVLPRVQVGQSRIRRLFRAVR